MVLTAGDKLHIITRRRFETDLRRHFVGVVEEASGTQLKLKGYVFVYDESENDFVRRDEERIRVFSVSDSGLIMNLLPRETELGEVRYHIDRQGRRVVTDGKGMSLNVSEFGAKR